MNTTTGNPSPSFLRDVLAPALLAMILFTMFAGGRDLWSPDEPRYARVAAEMMQRGDYVQPYYNGLPYREKPPLFFWSIILLTKLFGLDYPNIWTAVLPSAAAGVLCVLIVCLWTRTFLPRPASAGAGWILASSALFVWTARRGQLDILLTFFLTAALISLYRAFTEEKPWKWTILAGLAIGGAMYTKGMGFLASIVGLVFVLAAKQERKKRLFLLLVATGLGLLMFAPWFLASRTTGGIDVGKQFTRFTEKAPHQHGPWFFLYVLPLAFLPWSLPLIPRTYRFFRQREWRKLRNDSPQAFCAVWALSLLVFFSVIPSKRELYMLPLFPSLSILAADTFRRIEADRAMSWLAKASLVLVGAVGLGLMAAPFIVRHVPSPLTLPTVPLVASGLLVGAAAFAGWRFFDRSRGWSVVYASFAAIFFLTAAVSGAIFPEINKLKSPRTFCGVILRNVSTPPRVGIYASRLNNVRCYLPFPQPMYRFDRPEDAETFLDQDGALLIVEKKKYRRYPEELKRKHEIICSMRVSTHTLLLIRRKRGQEPATKNRDQRRGTRNDVFHGASD